MKTCQHQLQKLSWYDYHDDAKKRAARGEKQKRCKVCGLWVWESLWRKRRKRK